ncbi:MAG TPA: hypothetical protein VHC72_00380, partial [Bryobacteraceae bacterium]|nr:hypothetical protein [Bryobacteraceae bacterium]
FESRLQHVAFSSRLTWRDYPTLVGKIRNTLSSGPPADRVEKKLAPGEEAPSTFLYALRKAMLAPGAHASRNLVYNGREFLLRTTRKPDPEAGARFAGRNLVEDAGRVARIDATLREKLTGRLTAFKLWFEIGSEQLPPLCFEYRPKSFLRLTFEFDPISTAPPISLALNRKETA